MAVGTVLGLPTYGELADLVAVQRFNLAQIDTAKSSCAAWAAKDPTAYGAWAAAVFDATATLTSALDQADSQLALIPESIRDVTPVISALGTTNSWNAILKAAGPFHQLVSTFALKSGCAWPAGTPPQPTAPDFDLKVFQWTGKALNAVQFGGSLGLILLAAFFFLSPRGSR